MISCVSNDLCICRLRLIILAPWWINHILSRPEHSDESREEVLRPKTVTECRKACRSSLPGYQAVNVCLLLVYSRTRTQTLARARSHTQPPVFVRTPSMMSMLPTLHLSDTRLRWTTYHSQRARRGPLFHPCAIFSPVYHCPYFVVIKRYDVAGVHKIWGDNGDIIHVRIEVYLKCIY